MAHRGPSRSGSAGYRRSHLPHPRSDIDTLPSRRSSAGSETGDSFTDAGDDGVRVLCEQRDELERRMAVLSTQQRKLEQQMCALSPNGVASQATPPPPRPLRQPQLPPLPGWPLAFPPTAPHEPVFDQGMVPPPPPPPPETPPPPKGGWSVVRSPADYSAQAPLPWHAQGAVPLLIDAMEGLMAVMGFSHEIADLTDMVDAVHKMTAALASRDAPPKAEMSTAATSPMAAAAAASVSASPAYDREAEQMRVLKHRLKKREDELAALKAAAAGRRGLAAQPTQQPGRALSPPRRPQAAAVAVSAAAEQGSLVALAVAAPEEHPTTGPEIRLAEIDEELAAVQAQEEKYLSKRESLLQKRGLTEQSLDQQETALRRSEEWWARKKQEAAFTHRQQVEELRSGGLLGDSEGEPQASDLSEYDTVVEESTLQCKRLTDRVKGLLQKLDADLVRSEQQLEAAAASRARLLAERADTLSLVHELASTREPSV